MKRRTDILVAFSSFDGDDGLNGRHVVMMVYVVMLVASNEASAVTFLETASFLFGESYCRVDFVYHVRTSLSLIDGLS